LDPHENPNERTFFLKLNIAGLRTDNETKAIVKLFTGAELVLNHKICRVTAGALFFSTAGALLSE
jgi:hypothetical protein